MKHVVLNVDLRRRSPWLDHGLGFDPTNSLSATRHLRTTVRALATHGYGSSCFLIDGPSGPRSLPLSYKG